MPLANAFDLVEHRKVRRFNRAAAQAERSKRPPPAQNWPVNAGCWPHFDTGQSQVASGQLPTQIIAEKAMVDARLVWHHLTVIWLYIRHPKPLRVLCNGKTSAFQADDTGSIPVTRSKYSFQTNYLQNSYQLLGKYLINIDNYEL